MMAGGFFLLQDTISGALELLGAGNNLDEVEVMAQQMLADAKANAPWGDRTSEARDGLEVEVSDEGGDIVVTLMHTAEHGQWLETIQSGRFAIIMPTLEKYGTAIQQAVAEGIFSGG